MILKGGVKMKDFQIILEEAAFAGLSVDVFTKGRGIIRGKFTGVDEFDTDEERLGFYLSLGDGWEDTVFLDEITDIHVIPRVGVFNSLQQSA